MGRRKKTQFDISALDNTLSYSDYIYKLLELGISRFQWNDLPPTIDERFLELTLMTDGQAVYFRDEVMGDLALQVMIGGPLDVYRVPIERTAFAANGYNKRLDNTNSVIIWNNLLRTNTYYIVLKYAKLLYDLDQIINVNLRAQKTPVLIKGTPQQKMTLENVYKQYDGNEPVIFGYQNLDLNDITVLKTDAPYVADRIYDMKTKYWNEALTALGISNVTMSKKERLISDEVNRSMGGTVAMRNSGLEARRYAADQINAMFGTNISVNFRDTDASLDFDEDIVDNDAKEEEDDG